MVTTRKSNLRNQDTSVLKMKDLKWVQLYLLKNNRCYLITMFALDRETAVLAAVVVCIAASLYMYNELRQSKDDITKIKSYLDHVQEESQHVQVPRMVVPQEPEEVLEFTQEPEVVVVPTKPKPTEKRVTRGKSPVDISSE